MRELMSKIREPVRQSWQRSLLFSSLICLAGVMLGLISKVLDQTPSNLLPSVLESLDLRNFFSRLGVWIFLAVVIAVYSRSPVRSALNVLLFFLGMLSSYYLYTVMVAGFFPRDYMMFWLGLAVISPFLAYVCWYARGKGPIAVLISSVILMFMSRQTFTFGFWYFDMKYLLEFILWIATILIFYRSPKQIAIVAVIGLLLYFVTSQVYMWGLL